MSVAISTGLSTEPNTEEAFRAAADQALEGLDGRRPDLVALFGTPSHAEYAESALETVTDSLDPHALIGCLAQGVIAKQLEIEGGPGATVWAASFDGGSVETFHLTDDSGLDTAGIEDSEVALLVTDPLSFDTESFLSGLRFAHVDTPIVGGLAGTTPSETSQVMFLDRTVKRTGAIGVRLNGVPVAAAVSQGAVPVGPEMVVTEARGNVITELASRPAVKRLEEILTSLGSNVRGLLARGLLLGVVIDENKPEYLPGDYLIRGVLGADHDTGALAVGASIRVGQTVRLHARDPDSAHRDLKHRISAEIDRSFAGSAPAGALLFSCNGRGTGMFGTSHHDAQALSGYLDRPSLGGFFCAGEIGPVGGQNFLHGFTATVALFGSGSLDSIER